MSTQIIKHPLGKPKTRRELRGYIIELLQENGVPKEIRELLNLDNKGDQKAIAVGLIAAGNTGRSVAEQTGLKESSLWSTYDRWLGPQGKDRSARRMESEARIEAGASAVAEASLAEMASDLEENGDKLRPGDKTKYFQAANKALERSRSRLGSGDGDGGQWQQIFAKMAEGEGGTIKVDIEPRKVIDVGESGEIGNGEVPE